MALDRRCGNPPPFRATVQSQFGPPSRRQFRRPRPPIALIASLILCGILGACSSPADSFLSQRSPEEPAPRISLHSQAGPGTSEHPTTGNAAQHRTEAERTGHSAPAPPARQKHQHIDLPLRDLRDLALRLRPGVHSIPQAVPGPPFSVGDRAPFWVSDLDSNRQHQIEAELRYKNDVTYIWVESGRETDLPALSASADRFAHTIYPLVRDFFGHEPSPGIDADPRLHILHASGLGRGIAGYFSSADLYSAVANPFSNQKEMFYINLDWLNRGTGNEHYETVLAHEFQHMVHWHNDRNEETWVNEGMSELAQEVAGYPPDLNFARRYNLHPDTQLNTWSTSPDGNGRHYGSAYLLMAYFLQRFGEELTQAVVSQPANGLLGFTNAFRQAGLDLTFEDLFADWVIANYANEYSALGKQGVYGYRQLQLPRPSLAESFYRYSKQENVGAVRNFGVDFIALRGRGDLSFHFEGMTGTRYANAQPYSGSFAWWSNRADESDCRLTRAFDFSSLPAGADLTMYVQMWFDIEEDYDYGYVLASRDGRKWDILPGQRTTTANPSGNSFGHAYTARSGAEPRDESPAWIQEAFDLSAYAGDEVYVRFEYVTDDAVNAPGWFIDDIAIPAISYSTDFEQGEDGWESEGWLLTDNRLPQEWLLQTMVFNDGALVSVERAQAGPNGRLRIDVDGQDRGQEVVLAISGLTPGTTEEATYKYRIERR